MNLTVSHAGEWASLGAALAWSASTMIFRAYGQQVSATWLTFFKGVVALFFLGLTILLWEDARVLEFEAILLLGLSGIIGISIGDSAFLVRCLKLVAR